MAAPAPVSLGQDYTGLRRALGQYPTGVAIVTTRSQRGDPIGLTINSFASLSLEPPIVLWNLRRESPSHPDFVASGRFAINVLCGEQIALAQRFAAPSSDRFDGVALLSNACDSAYPILAECAAWFACETVHAARGGDHTLFAGRVCAFGRSSGDALGFYRGSYFSMSSIAAHPTNTQAK